jgi:hypothetical protein
MYVYGQVKYSINKMVIEIHILTPKLSILDCEILWCPITIENIGQNDQNNRNVTEIWLPIIYQNHFTNDKNIWQETRKGPNKRLLNFFWKQCYPTQNAFSIVLI